MSAQKKRRSKKPEKPTPPPKLTKNEYELAVLNTTQRYGIIRFAIIWVGIVFVAFLMYLSIQTIAGQSTTFNSALEWNVRFGISEGLAWVLATLFGTGYYLKSNQHKRYIATHAPRLAELESIIDPQRSSSGLRKDGESPHGDPQ